MCTDLLQRGECSFTQGKLIGGATIVACLAHGKSRLRRFCRVASASSVGSAALQRSFSCSRMICRPAKLQSIEGPRTRAAASFGAHAHVLQVLHAELPIRSQCVRITFTAAHGAAQLCSAHVDVRCGMCHGQIHSSAQRAAHAAQSCNVVALLIALPGILLEMFHDAAKYIHWQIDDSRMRCCLTSHGSAAARRLHAATDAAAVPIDSMRMLLHRMRIELTAVWLRNSVMITSCYPDLFARPRICCAT
jgi:hypothetical protein